MIEEARSSTWVQQILANYHDGLFDKLANPREGWSVFENDKNVDVPLNDLDAAAYKILLNALDKNKKIALAVPKVKSGVSLSLVAYLVVNRFLKRFTGRSIPDFIPANIDNDKKIIVITKNKKLRDFFLESSLSFNNFRCYFSQFPIFRINNKEEIVPLINSRHKLEKIQTPPIIFYHLERLENYSKELNNNFCIGEISESDSKEILNRYLQFIKSTNSTSAIIIVNEFATNVINKLKENDFEIINFGKDDILNVKTKCEIANLPSLGSAFSFFPKKISLSIELIEDEFINNKIERIQTILLDLKKNLKNYDSLLLYKIWNIFYNLKDLAVSLSLLEERRKKNSWLKSLQYNIEQIFNFPLSRLNSDEKSILEPVWGTLGLEINELYDYLLSANPKRELLVEYFKKLNPNKSACLIFTNQLQADILKEELFTEFGWVEAESNFKVINLKDYNLYSDYPETIILVGSWKYSDGIKIMSLLPKNLHLFIYPHELTNLTKSINFLNGIDSYYRDQLMLKTLTSLNLDKTFAYAEGGNWIEADQDSSLIIGRYIPSYNKPLGQNLSLEDILGGYGDESEITDESIEDQGLILSTGEDNVSAYNIKLENGRNIFIPVDKEITTYSEEEDEIQANLPDALKPGDVILLYSAEQNREMFLGLLERTQQLSKVDPKIMNFWKNVMLSLKESYDIDNIYSVRPYLRDLKGLGCTKTDVTMKNWLKGRALAPNDQQDVESILKLLEYKNSSILSKIVLKEVEALRYFNRRLGKRLKARLISIIKQVDDVETKDNVDNEIDEILESIEPAVVNGISPTPKLVAREEINLYIF